jgi:phosphate transport system protein
MRLSGNDLFDRLMGGYSRPVVELRTEYHRQLGEIDAAVMGMFTVVEEDIGATAAAFLHGDDMAAATVEGHDEVIEDLYAKIEDLVHVQLVRQAPVAGELRFLLTVFRILPELTRTHALAADVSRRGATGLAEELPPRVVGLIGQHLDAAAKMWHQVTQVYLMGSSEIADNTEDDDDALDELHASLSAELAAADLRSPVLLEMGLIARLLERLGDYAVEVARQIEALERPGHTPSQPAPAERTETDEAFRPEPTLPAV